MSQGSIETARGASMPHTESYIARHNATPDDLAQARTTFLNQPVRLPHRPHARLRCVDVRLDQLRRLIFDLVHERSMPAALPGADADAEEAHADDA